MIDKIDKELLFAFGQGIVRGKNYRDLLINDYPALGNEFTGKFLQPQILHACTDFTIRENLSQNPKVRITEKKNKRNYSFLQIETENFYMTTSRVEDCDTVPRDAYFRCNRAMSNQQQVLFPDFEEQLPQGKPYLILVHGLIEQKENGEILFEELFGGIGMPCGDDPSRWIDFLSLSEYLVKTVPEETIDELDPGFLKLKKNFLGNDDPNDVA